MNIIRKALEFEKWFNSPQFPEELEMADVEELVLVWAETNEVDLGDNMDAICRKIVDLGIC